MMVSYNTHIKPPAIIMHARPESGSVYAPAHINQ